jgi:DNA-binding transcriptional LysR family regulator
LNLRQLEAFRAVMETGSVTRGAALLGVSQPAASKLVAALERHCGFPLFHRHGNRLFPTAEASTLYGEVERMYVSADHVARHVEGIRELRSGQLSIAAFPAIAARALPRMITGFMADHARINVSLVSRSSRLLVEWVASEQVDVGIGLMTLDRVGVAFEPVGRFEGVCVVPAGHRLARRKTVHARDLHGEPFIALGVEDRSRFKVDQAFEGTPIRRDILIEAQQSEAACAFVAEGAGVSIVEPFSAMGFDPSQLVARRFRPAVWFDMWFILPTSRPRSRLTEEFLTFFRRSIERYRPYPLGVLQEQEPSGAPAADGHPPSRRAGSSGTR